VSRRTVEEWRRAVYMSPRVNDATRVLLLYLADHMRADRTVSVPQATIAKGIGKSPRRVAERVKQGLESGLLDRKAPGYRGHTAIYQGLFPNAESMSPTSTLSSAETRTLSPLERVRHGGYPTTRADLTARVADRDVGNDEKPEDRPAVVDLPVCQWHGHARCPDDCANHPANREATA
jgi:hypothetical protein